MVRIDDAALEEALSHSLLHGDLASLWKAKGQPGNNNYFKIY